MPRLVATPVIAVLSACLLFAPLPAAGCSVQEVTTDDEKFAKATEVFLARVVRVEEAATPARWGTVEFKAVQGTYKLVEVFKGEPKDGDTVVDFVFNPGNCSLGIMAGLHYIFFIRPETRLVLWVGGSRGYINLEGSVPKADIGRFRALAGKAGPAPNRQTVEARLLRVRVKPNARVSTLNQEPDGTWLARLKSPPVDGKANAELIELVAKQFGCARASVSIKSGAGGRNKLVKISVR